MFSEVEKYSQWQGYVKVVELELHAYRRDSERNGRETKPLKLKCHQIIGRGLVSTRWNKLIGPRRIFQTIDSIWRIMCFPTVLFLENMFVWYLFCLMLVGDPFLRIVLFDVINQKFLTCSKSRVFFWDTKENVCRNLFIASSEFPTTRLKKTSF